MTGAEDSIKPESLVKISQDFPFVEWGILLKDTTGGRFPSMKWVSELKGLNVNLSGHICGKWCRDIFQKKNIDFPREIFDIFPRIQLNFSPYAVPLDLIPFLKTFPEKQFIFQIGKKSQADLIWEALNQNLNFSCLLDRSGGKGEVPGKWPELIPNVFCGQAGGLGPDTLETELPKIAEVVGEQEIWIDMESRIRTDGLFDLNKVLNCLKITNKWSSDLQQTK